MSKKKDNKTYKEKLNDWYQTLDDSLRKEDGWLALAGLYWLEEGENSVGTDSANDIVLDVSSGPERLGTFILDEGGVKLSVFDGIEVVFDGERKTEMILKPDSSGAPTEIKFNHLTFMLLEREDGLAIRLWDNQGSKLKNFTGRCWLPVNNDYLLEGRYHPYQKEVDMTFSRKNGADFSTQVQGEVRFCLDGKEYSLISFEQEDGSLFTLFYDQTNGKESYPSGRFLYLDPPQEGKVEVDFNRAYNPPCAFTDYATCPLPPAQNRIEVSVLAGERMGVLED